MTENVKLTTAILFYLSVRILYYILLTEKTFSVNKYETVKLTECNNVSDRNNILQYYSISETTKGIYLV